MPQALEVIASQCDKDPKAQRCAIDKDKATRQREVGIQIRKLVGSIDKSPTRDLDSAKKIGQLINQARQDGVIRHGELVTWRNKYFPNVKKRTIEQYREIAHRWKRIADRKPSSINEALAMLGEVRSFTPEVHRKRSEALDKLISSTHPFDMLTKLDSLPKLNLPSKRVRKPGSIFLDSGMHALVTKYKTKPDYFMTSAFMKYVEEYADFVFRHKDQLDHYASCDVRVNPEAGFRAHVMLLGSELHPVPAIHATLDIEQAVEYLHRYTCLGHDYVGIGGFFERGDASRAFMLAVSKWADTHAPDLTFHLYGVASPWLILDYDRVVSADASTWEVATRNGQVLVPSPGTEYTDQAASVKVAIQSSKLGTEIPRPWSSLTALDRVAVYRALERHRIPYGRCRQLGFNIVDGTGNDYRQRVRLNVEYFKHLESHVRSMGRNFNYYFSGTCTPNPEEVVDEACIMPTYSDMRTNKRWKRVNGYATGDFARPRLERLVAPRRRI